jgi:hypothetical protein
MIDSNWVKRRGFVTFRWGQDISGWWNRSLCRWGIIKAIYEEHDTFRREKPVMDEARKTIHYSLLVEIHLATPFLVSYPFYSLASERPLLVPGNVSADEGIVIGP